MDYPVFTSAVIDQDNGESFVELTTGAFDEWFDPVVHLCRICAVFTGVSQFGRGTELPRVHPSMRCPRGHLLTLPDHLVVTDLYVQSRSRKIVPQQREVVRAGSLSMGQALTLLTAAQAVVDGKGELAVLSEAVEAAPEPIRKLRTSTKMTRDQWIGIAGLLVGVLGILVPLIANSGPAEPTVIQIHLDETRAKDGGHGETRDGEGDSGAGNGVVDPSVEGASGMSGDPDAVNRDDHANGDRREE